jgi:membrane protease YdiL (CAAX protease family)
MSDPDSPGLPEALPPEPVEPAEPEPPPPPAPERYPFWTYTDLFVFIGLAVAGQIAGALLVQLALLIAHAQVRNEILKLLPAQFLGYLFLFLCVRLMFRAQYGRPFLSSLGWTEPPLKTVRMLAFGVLRAFVVGILSVPLKTPETTPLTKLLADRTSVLVVAVVGVTFGPLCEELIFRGFLQPLLVRSLGALAGILLASLPFGLLHLQEYGNSWQHGLLITAAGAAFGWMRHSTGSTKASTLMHAAYNGTFFIALLAQRKDLLHL